jgi:hypothetical protein
MKNKKPRLVLILDILAILLPLSIFLFIVFKEVGTDIQLHSRMVKQIKTNQIALPGNFLYYFIVDKLTFYTKNAQIIQITSALLVSVMVSLKYFISKRIIATLGLKLTTKEVSVLAFSLLFIFSLPHINYVTNFSRYYLGMLPPNVWHNSTTIMVMPFALLLFWQSTLQLRYHSIKRLYLIAGLIVLNILLKPSFFFVFAAVYPLMLLIQYKISKSFAINLIPVVIGLLLIYVEFVFLFNVQTESGIIIEPFKVWGNFMPRDKIIFIPVAILLSWTFPIGVFVLCRSLIPKLEYIYLTLLALAGIGLYALLMEDNSRRWDANFSWQNIMVGYILFLVSSTLFFSHKKEIQASKRVLLYSAYALHLLSGVFYLYKVLIVGDYR